MTIRLALIAAACIGAAGCTPSANLGGVMSSMRADEPPPRTCRNVTADVVLISSRASAAAGLVAQEPRLGIGGVTEVAWPMQGVAANQIIVDLMARIKAESELIGCPISFQESLPPASPVVAVVPAPVVPEAATPVAPRSAWNGPAASSPAQAVPPVPAARPSAPPAPAAAAAPVPAAKPALPKVSIAPAKPASRPVERPVAQAAATPGTFVPAPPAATKPVAVDQTPRRNVRAIPIGPAEAPAPTP